MKISGSPSRLRSCRGSAFLTVIIYTMVLAAMVASILQWSLNERRLNMRNGYWLEARNAAEAVAEYGFSQVRNQFALQASPPSFDPGGANPLVLPPASFWSGGNVNTTDYSGSHPGVQLIGGTAQYVPSSGAVYFIDDKNLNNENDVMKGRWVFRRDIAVVAKATVVPPNGGGAPVTAYVTESVSVRGAPLFSNAIFYSANDLEIAPGPQMDIWGPVHVNGNMFVSSQNASGTTSLNFHGPVTASGNIYHAWSNANNASHGSGSETLGQTAVNFVNNAGTLVNLNTTGNSTGWKDSTMGADNGVSGLSALAALVPADQSAFRTNTSQNFNGNLQTAAMSVMAYYPIANKQVVAQNTSVTPAIDLNPDPHVIIDPPNASLSPSDAFYTGKHQVEVEKYSMKAGLYIQVDPSNATEPVKLFGPAGSAPVGTPAANMGPNGGIKLVLPANAANDVANATTPPLVKYVPFRSVKTTVTYSSSTHLYTTTPTVYKANATVDAGLTPAPSTSGSGTAGTTYGIFTDAHTGASYGYGMYDQRRGSRTDYSSTGVPANNIGSTDLVQVDMKALRAAVQAIANNTLDATNSIKNADGTLWTGWNGGIYVEAKNDTPATTPYLPADYPSTLSNQTTSVRLVDGTVASSSSLIPTVAGASVQPGLTVATNAPVYILGNFNADGTITLPVATASATTPDDGNSGAVGRPSAESPVCIAADSVTILSPIWSDANSLKVSNTSAPSVEVAAALLTGLQATSNTASSGGAHNLPRFLENWSGRTVAIRGSLVTTFSCKVATQPWSTAYYGAPGRQWGFDKIFLNGHYPPLSPNVMDYRRVTFKNESASDYAAQLHLLWPSRF